MLEILLRRYTMKALGLFWIIASTIHIIVVPDKRERNIIILRTLQLSHYMKLSEQTDAYQTNNLML